MESKESLMVKLPFWENLNMEEKNIVKAGSFLRTYKKGEAVQSGCGDCLGMLFILKGEIRAFLLSEEGREITLFRLLDGESCVLTASCVISQITFETQMLAEKDTEVLIIPSLLFGKLVDSNIYVRCFMYELTTRRFSTVMWTMQQILFHRFDKRLSNFLLKEYERTGLKTIRMTHDQIAKDLGSAREVVARMLKRFSQDGIVEVNRGAVKLKDLEKLKNI